MTRIAECTRHHMPYEPTEDHPMYPYWTKRCTHIGRRFVVEIWNKDRPVFIDYVEDLPDGDVLVEDASATGDPAEDEHIWQCFVEKMVADISPDPEQG